MRAREVICGVVVLWGVAAPHAFAETPASLAEAQRLSAAGESAQALAVLDQLLAAKPSDAPALQLRAKVLLDARDWGAALTAYEAYIKVAPAGANKRSAQQIVKNLEPVRSTAFALTVTTATAEAPANVYLDSKSLGVFCVAAPTCTKNVLPGAHRLIIDTEGFEKDSSQVTFELGKTLTIERTPAHKPSAVTIESTPSGAQVTIDGAPRGSTPLSISLPGGDHQLALSLDGYLSATQTVTAARGAMVVTSVVLARGVPVTAPTEGATYQVDGVTVELRDGAVPVPADGQAHTVQISAPERLASTVDVPAEPPAGFTIPGALRPAKIALRFTGRAGGVIKVDGEAVGTLPLAEPWRGAPGAHVIEVSAGDATPVRREATFEADHDVAVDVAPATGGRTRMWIAGGVSLAALATSATFGVLALGKESDYNARARAPGVTADDAQLGDLKSSGTTFALVSDIALGAAIAGAGVTTWFLLTGRKATASEVLIQVSPSGASVGHTF